MTAKKPKRRAALKRPAAAVKRKHGQLRGARSTEAFEFRRARKRAKLELRVRTPSHGQELRDELLLRQQEDLFGPVSAPGESSPDWAADEEPRWDPLACGVARDPTPEVAQAAGTQAAEVKRPRPTRAAKTLGLRPAVKAKAKKAKPKAKPKARRSNPRGSVARQLLPKLDQLLAAPEAAAAPAAALAPAASSSASDADTWVPPGLNPEGLASWKALIATVPGLATRRSKTPAPLVEQLANRRSVTLEPTRALRGWSNSVPTQRRPAAAAPEAAPPYARRLIHQERAQEVGRKAKSLSPEIAPKSAKTKGKHGSSANRTSRAPTPQ